jgi:hypothetical protein
MPHSHLLKKTQKNTHAKNYQSKLLDTKQKILDPSKYLYKINKSPQTYSPKKTLNKKCSKHLIYQNPTTKISKIQKNNKKFQNLLNVNKRTPKTLIKKLKSK